jgi:23S rRNA pseudouridine1911/1915/1917 synthase
VLDFYADRYRHSLREAWRARILSGEVLLDGQQTEPDVVLTRGRVLSYHRQPWTEPDAPTSFAVLYRDEHVLAVAKPSGLPVLPGGGHLQNTLLASLRRRFGEDPAPIHRLGRGTSGVMLFARSDVAKRRLSEDLSKGRLTKIYLALAFGVDLADQFIVDTPIGRIPYPEIRYVYAANPAGKPSRSECRVLHRQPEYDRSIVQVQIITGRPHQIRIHLAAAGHPLVDDPLYGPGGTPLPAIEGARVPMPGDVGYHLHAHQVTFTHPTTDRPVTVTCQPPPILRVPNQRRGSPSRHK